MVKPDPLPEKGESWIEQATDDLFTVKNIDHWRSGSITVHAINVPLMRMWTGPLDSFLEKFKPIEGKEK